MNEKISIKLKSYDHTVANAAVIPCGFVPHLCDLPQS